MRGEWAVPVILALVTGGLAHLYLPDDPQRLFTVSEPDTVLEGPYVLLPADGSHGPSTLLRYDATPRHGIGDVLDLHAGASNGTHWTWDGRDGTCLRGGDCTPQGTMTLRLDHVTWHAPPGGPQPTGMAAPGPSSSSMAAPGDDTGSDDQAGADGTGAPGNDTGPHGETRADGTLAPGNETRLHSGATGWTVRPGTDTLRVTFFLFDGDGFLLATNTPSSTWEAFDLHGDFTYVPDALWHIDAGPAPDGARKVPAYRGAVRELLEGAAVGSVQSGVLVQHQYDWYLGPVWLTLRVEGIIPAVADPDAR